MTMGVVLALGGCAAEESSIAVGEPPSPVSGSDAGPSEPAPGVECQHDSECLGTGVDATCQAIRCLNGTCQQVPRADGQPCEDQNACTELTWCSDGVCSGGQEVSCHDDNPCTADSCDPTIGCLFLPEEPGSTCDDGDPCTKGDTCEGGVCTGTFTTHCACEDDHDCAKHQDVDLCNGLLRCFAGQCQVDATTIVTCTAQDACTQAFCVPETGHCEQAPVEDGTACDDGQPCTDSSECSQGTCVGQGNICPCASDDDCLQLQQEGYDYCQGPLVCAEGTCSPDPGQAVVCEEDDGAPCVAQACQPATGVCVSVPLADETGCVVSAPCAAPGVCQQGSCEAVAAMCEDGNPCTQDLCEEGECLHLATEGPCDDGDPCSEGESCSGELSCEGGIPVNCDDGNPCTADSCDPSYGGCVSNPIAEGETCLTKNLCLGPGICVDGLCQDQKSISCEPDDPCMTSQCIPEQGCVVKPQPDGQVCNDGNPCTMEGTCVGGMCSTLPVPCNDEETCTLDECDPLQGGCVHTPLGDGVGCQPQNLCLKGGACAQGICEGGTPVTCANTACAQQACSTETGACIIVASLEDGTPCGEDAPCTSSGLCMSGTCETPIKEICDDGNACTVDVCDAASGSCSHLPLPCPAPAGQPCVESMCAPDVGCVKLNSPQCEDLEQVVWSTSFPCDDVAAWSANPMPGSPAFQLGPPPGAQEPWDEDCALFIEIGEEANGPFGSGPWEAFTSSAPFMPPATGQMTISFVELWSGADIERTVTVLTDPNGETSSGLGLADEPSEGTGWQKTTITVEFDAAEQPVQVQFGASGDGDAAWWAIDKLVIGWSP